MVAQSEQGRTNPSALPFCSSTGQTMHFPMPDSILIDLLICSIQLICSIHIALVCQPLCPALPCPRRSLGLLPFLSLQTKHATAQ